MNFQISVSRYGVHLFSTSTDNRSTTNWLIEVHTTFLEKFPPEEGFKVRVRARNEKVDTFEFADIVRMINEAREHHRSGLPIEHFLHKKT